MRCAIAASIFASVASGQDGWTHAGRTPSRVSVIDAHALPDLGAPAWTFDADGTFEAVRQATPVISEDGVAIALGTLAGEAHAIALDVSTGDELWRVPIDAPVFGSWSSPAVLGGRANGRVIVASGTTAVALDLATGTELWATPLGQSVVNASPAIDGDASLVRLTTYDPFGDAARLLTLELDSGNILLGPTIGSASGATPAVDGSLAFVALVDGSVKALDGGMTLWMASNPVAFFGGTVVDDGAVFAASYGFSGGRDNSNIIKLDAATGAVLWRAPAERTDAIPTPLGDGRIVLSAGLDGFGSLPTVQVYRDLGSSAARVWDLASATWDDLNGNGRIDPGEYLALGGWDHQPAAIRTADGAALLVGSPTGGLALLDLETDAGDPAFVLASSDLGGGSPAIANGVAVSMWSDHVAGFAIGGPCIADFDGDGALTLFDFLAFQNAFDAGTLAADCDGDGSLTLFDFLCFQNAFDTGCG